MVCWPFLRLSARWTLLVHHVERVLSGELGGDAFLLAVCVRIDALGHQGPRLIAQSAGFKQRDFWIGAEGHPL